jgi:hypothetical protein
MDRQIEMKIREATKKKRSSVQATNRVKISERSDRSSGVKMRSDLSFRDQDE